MITRVLYDKMLQKYGGIGSWAVWEPQGEKAKSNIGPENIFNFDKNPDLLDDLTNEIIMVGLNLSRSIEEKSPFSNFHDENPRGNDFKIRFAFLDTPYCGAYMTDVLKNVITPDSQSIRSYIRKNPDVIKDHLGKFQQELDDLEAKKPLILAFGKDAFDLLNDYLPKHRYKTIIRLTHYSYQISKENYRKEVLSQISNALLD